MKVVVSEIELYEILAKELGNDKAKALVHYVEHKVDNEIKDFASILATKEDIANLRAEFKEDIANLRAEFKEDIAGLRTEFKEDMAGLRAKSKEDMAGLRTEVKEDIANSKIEIIRWMFGIFIAIMLAIIGLYFKH